MASTNQTTNYGLPIYSQSDKASWVDTNQPFEEIDADLHTAKITADSASTQATANAENITDLQTRMSAAEGSLTTLEGTTIPTMQDEIDAAKTAGGTSYNNSDSGLSATTDQSAIDEIVAKLRPTTLATITGDGTITYRQALHTFYDTLNGLTEKQLKSGVTLEKVESGYIQRYRLTNYKKDTMYHFDVFRLDSSISATTCLIMPLATDCKYAYANLDNSYSYTDYTGALMPTTTFNLILNKNI